MAYRQWTMRKHRRFQKGHDDKFCRRGNAPCPDIITSSLYTPVQSPFLQVRGLMLLGDFLDFRLVDFYFSENIIIFEAFLNDDTREISGHKYNSNSYSTTSLLFSMRILTVCPVLNGNAESCATDDGIVRYNVFAF